MYTPATLKQIAKALSVSTSTVSRALNDSHEVSNATKELIQNYAKKINYSSNPAATTLCTRRGQGIAVVVSEIDNNFFSQVINGIESVAYEKGYQIIIAQSHDSCEQEGELIRHLASRSVDGILISMSAESGDYNDIINFHDQGLPIVFFDRVLDQINTYKVITDNFKASFTAVDTLIKNGYNRIAHLTNAPQLSITKERLEGYKAALKHNNIPVDDSLIYFCASGGKSNQEVQAAVDDLMSKSPTVQAIFIGSDSLSIAMLRLLPANSTIKLLGFSNANVMDLVTPKISYIRQRAYEMGQIAAERLIHIIESPYQIHEFETTILNADLHLEDDMKKGVLPRDPKVF
jgi:LacI family transcriptional regulator